MQTLSELTCLAIGSGVSSDTGVRVDVMNTGGIITAWRTGAFIDVLSIKKALAVRQTKVAQYAVSFLLYNSTYLKYVYTMVEM
jgi:hypothetical protein